MNPPASGPIATVASVNVSRVRTFAAGGKRIRSGILKQTVAGRVRLHSLGLDGDAQADHRFHGGVDKAVCLYGAAHYDFWRSRIRGATLAGLMNLPFGTFGENLTLAGPDDLESALHVGDVLRVGDAVIELTDPRQPCWKLETRLGIEGFARAFLGSGRLGCYARVRTEGVVGAGDDVRLVERAAGAISLADLILAVYLRDERAMTRALASASLPERLRRRIERDEHRGE